MATVPTQVRIDENLKKQASELFSQLGMDMSGAMNIFLKQCVLSLNLFVEKVIAGLRRIYTKNLIRMILK